MRPKKGLRFHQSADTWGIEERSLQHLFFRLEIKWESGIFDKKLIKQGTYTTTVSVLPVIWGTMLGGGVS